MNEIDRLYNFDRLRSKWEAVSKGAPEYERKAVQQEKRGALNRGKVTRLGKQNLVGRKEPPKGTPIRNMGTSSSKFSLSYSQLSTALKAISARSLQSTASSVQPSLASKPIRKIATEYRTQLHNDAKDDARLIFLLQENANAKIEITDSGKPQLTQHRWGLESRKGISKASKYALQKVINRLEVYAKNGIVEIDAESGNKVSISELLKIILENPRSKATLKHNQELNSDIQKLEQTIIEATIGENIDDQTLASIIDQKDALARDNEGKYQYEQIYNFLNGISHFDNTPKEIGIPKDQYEDYFSKMAELRSMGRLNLKVEVQGGGFGQPTLSEENPTPWKALKTDIGPLPEKVQAYIKNLALVDHRFLRDSQKQGLPGIESKVKKMLSPEQEAVFSEGVKEAVLENGYNRGFIHFKPQDNEADNDPSERIYIQMNPTRSHELAKTLLLEVYGNPNEYPGVQDVKIAGPQVAGRNDGIVVYIGGDEKQARDVRNKIIDFLISIQSQDSDLLGSTYLPLKRQHGPGIASAPSPSEGRSFTEIMAKAVADALTKGANTPAKLKKGILAYTLTTSKFRSLE